MHLNNKAYDALKWLVLIVLPATAVLLQGIGDLYHIASIDTYVSTLNLFTAFIGTIVQISSNHYHNGGNHNDNGPGLA